MLPIMAWIVIMKRAGCRVNLHDVNPGELFDVTDEGTFRKPKRCAIAYLIKVTQTTPGASIWKLLKTTCTELKRLPAKSHIRGKFEAWWFVAFSQCILDGLTKVVGEANGSIKIHAQLTVSTFIQLLSGGIATPARLDAFLTFYTNRGGTLPPTAIPVDNRGMFSGIFSFLRR